MHTKKDIIYHQLYIFLHALFQYSIIGTMNVILSLQIILACLLFICNIYVFIELYQKEKLGNKVHKVRCCLTALLAITSLLIYFNCHSKNYECVHPWWHFVAGVGTICLFS